MTQSTENENPMQTGGDFSQAADLPQDHFISGLEPLTNKRKLRAFCEQMVALGYPGAEKALKALDYVVDGCASPMETTLCCLMVLPISEGGYEVPTPLAGHVLDLPPVARAVMGEEQLRCDLCWPEQRVAIEYDSDQFHTGRPGRRRDPLRKTALELSGYTVIPMTRGMVLNIKSFDAFVKRLSKALGISYRKPTQVELQKKRELRLEYFGSSSMW